MWWASELALLPSRAIEGPSPALLLIKNSTAASPMLMPLRLAENGLQRCSDTGSTSGGNHIGRAAQLQPIGEEVCRRAELLLLIVVVGGELMLTNVMGQSATGFVDARSAGAKHDADAFAAVGLNRLIDLWTNLQRRFQQQLIIAAALLDQLRRNRCQFTVNRSHRQRTFRHPARLALHTGAIAGKQIAGDCLFVAAQRADHPQCVQIGGHGVSALSGVTWYFGPFGRFNSKLKGRE